MSADRGVARVIVPDVGDGTSAPRPRWLQVEVDGGGTGLGPAVVAALDSPEPADAVLAAGECIPLTLAPGPFPTHVVVHPSAHPEHATAHVHADVMTGVVNHLTRRWLDRSTAPVHLHAGAVVDRGGRAVLVVGTSGAGKSTLIAHLVAAGLDLVNDEQVAVAPGGGFVGGFRRPIVVDGSGVAALPPGRGGRPIDRPADADHVLVAPEALGGTHRCGGRPVLVVVPERSDDADGVSPSPIDAPDAVVTLAANSLDLAAGGSPALGALAGIASTARAVRLRYRDASVAAAWIVAAVEAPGSPRSIGVLGRVAGPVDHVEIDGRVVVHDHRRREIVALDHPASAEWVETVHRPVDDPTAAPASRPRSVVAATGAARP